MHADIDPLEAEHDAAEHDAEALVAGLNEAQDGDVNLVDSYSARIASSGLIAAARRAGT
jgi:hypothetical protein